MSLLSAHITMLRARDPHWSNVVSLLNFQGSHGGVTFSDGRGKVWTPSGNAQIDTSHGWNAGLFDGNDRISTPDHADWDFGTALWTLEMWIFPVSVVGFQNILRKSAGANYAPFTIALDGDKLRTRLSNSAATGWAVDQISSIAISASTLTHVSAVRDVDNTFRQYVGGVQSGNTVLLGPLDTNASDVHIGALSDNTAGYNGLVRAFRATSGICRYPAGATFTPPPAPFPNF